MRYNPGNKEDLNVNDKYTSGGVYMTIDGTEYIGYYHTNGDIILSGKTNQDNKQRLLPLNNNSDFVKYINLKKLLYLDKKEPISMTVTPTTNDYENGYMTRYFIKKRNESSGKIYELDDTTYKSYKSDRQINKDLYYSIELKWKLTGYAFDIIKNGVIYSHGIIDTNRRTVEQNNVIMNGLDKFLTNLQQYSRFTHQV